MKTITAYKPFREKVAALDSSVEFDYEDPNGNRAARSHVHSLRLVKGEVEACRKREKAESLEYGRRVDAEATAIKDSIDALIEIHAEPLRRIKEREDARVAGLQEQVAWFDIASMPATPDGEPHGSNYLMDMLGRVKDVPLDDSWQEFIAEAGVAKDKAVAALERHIEAALTRECEAAELQRLREEAEANAKREEARRIAEAAAAKVREEAEEAARKQREAHEAALREAEEKAEQERREAERVLREQQEAAERREMELKLEAETKERQRLAAEDVARKAQAKREADKKNRARVHAEILDAIESLDSMKAIVDAMAAGNVPHVTITY